MAKHVAACQFTKFQFDGLVVVQLRWSSQLHCCFAPHQPRSRIEHNVPVCQLNEFILTPPGCRTIWAQRTLLTRRLCRNITNDWSDSEKAVIQESIAAKVGGKFDFVIFRDNAEDYDSDSDWWESEYQLRFRRKMAQVADDVHWVSALDWYMSE